MLNFFFRRSNFFLAIIVALFLPPAPISASEFEGSRYVDLLLVEWKNSKPLKTNLDDLQRSLEKNVIDDWRAFTTINGSIKNDVIDFKVGIKSTTVFEIANPIACEGSEFLNIISNIHKNFYANQTLQNIQNRHLLILMPHAGCIWIGKATSGGNQFGGGVLVLQDTFDPFVFSHELGHNLGLGHSNLLRCDSGMVDGDWSEDCKAIEYGGAIDVMGNVKTKSTLSTYHQWRLGLLSNEKVYQSWKSEEVELTASDVDGTFRAIFIKDRDVAYWLEYRRPSERINFNPGLVILRTDPPSSKYIRSPNPIDTNPSNTLKSVTSDYWMLNLGDYLYSPSGKSAGSMTLTERTAFTSKSGRISISVRKSSNSDSILVGIKQAPDVKPPVEPSIRPQQTWSDSNDFVIENSYSDDESAISKFEARIGQKIFELSGSPRYEKNENYLDPFMKERTLRVKDLPEGSYEIQFRGIDMLGNQSNWSNPTSIKLDKSPPELSEDVNLIDFSKDSMSFSLDGLADKGSGLCSTSISNNEGFIISASDLPSKPKFTVKRNPVSEFKLNTYDCQGNGSNSRALLTYEEISLDRIRRTGQWLVSKNSGIQYLKCLTRCTASITLNGNSFIVSNAAKLNRLSNNRFEFENTSGKSNSRQVSQRIRSSGRAQTFRFSGSGFTIYAVVQIKLSLTESNLTFKKSRARDLSLDNQIQEELSRFGLTSRDFIDDWNIFPMQRGTTLEDPTLDFCSPSFVSDSQRLERRQVTIFKNASPYIFLSNEVVRYRDETSANRAFNELEEVVRRCRHNGGGVDSSGLFVRHSFLEIPAGSMFSEIGSKKIFLRVTIGTGSEARSLLGLYQFNRDLFSGLYVVKIGTNGFTDDEVLRWLDVASVIEARLTAVN